MNSLKYMLLLMLLAFTAVASAQHIFTGKIYDNDTKEPLSGVSIINIKSGKGTTTTSSGTFMMKSSSSVDSLELRYIGYQSQRLRVVAGSPLITGLHISESKMQEMVITASRNAQVRADVPMAISKISTSTINDTKPVLITELVNKVPGVVMTNYSNEEHNMSIRQPMGTSAYFLYMEDGIPIRPMGVFNHNSLLEMNVMALSSIEVVKGPASSLYGPEAVGGAINFITQKPTAVTTVRAGVQLDNFGYRRVQYGAGGMINKKLGFYLGGFNAKQTDGWISNSDYTKHAVNARFDYELSKTTRLILAGSYNDYDAHVPASADSISFYNKEYSSSADFAYRKVKAARVRFAIEHDWNENNQTTLNLFYRNNTTGQNPAYSISWTQGATTASGQINENRFKSKGFILQHKASIKKLRTNLIAGISIDNSPNNYDAYKIELNATLRPDGKSVEKYTVAAERPDIILTDYYANIVNSGLYVQAEIKPLDKLSITLGGRYDDMSFNYENYLGKASGKRSYHQFTPKIGATYKMSTQVAVYANYSLGFSPPGLTSVFRQKPNTSPAEFYYNLKPASFINYELGGWASLVKNKLAVDIAIYQMLGSNELLSIRLPDNTSDYQSAGKTTHRGIEYGLTYRPNTQWMVRVSGTNALHRFDEFLLSTNTTDAVKNINDKRMPNAPSWIVNSEVVYKPRFIKGLRAGIEWQHMSSWYQNQVNTVKYGDKGVFGLLGVSVLHFRAGYEWKGFELFTNIMNLTNELYAASASRGNAANSTTTFYPAPPRTFVFGIQYSFTGKK